jgi:hypothetical protein
MKTVIREIQEAAREINQSLGAPDKKGHVA